MSVLRSHRWDVWYSLLLVGAGAALAGLAATAVALRFAGMPPAEYYAVFYPTAPLAAALVGPSLWWWAIIKPGRLSVRRGIGVGVLGASLAHPLAWYIALVLAFLMGERTIGGVNGGITVTNPVQDLFASLVLAAFSLIYVGWITALIGASPVGWLLCSNPYPAVPNAGMQPWPSKPCIAPSQRRLPRGPKDIRVKLAGMMPTALYVPGYL